ncbi:hypothetical protein M8C21_025996, partial [Ambrosia artemisiifolia]
MQVLIQLCGSFLEASYAAMNWRMWCDLSTSVSKLVKGAAWKAICAGFEETTKSIACLTEIVQRSKTKSDNNISSYGYSNLGGCKLFLLLDNLCEREWFTEQGDAITCEFKLCTCHLAMTHQAACQAIGGGAYKFADIIKEKLGILNKFYFKVIRNVTGHT